jgi:hypothetical protein
LPKAVKGGQDAVEREKPQAAASRCAISAVVWTTAAGLDIDRAAAQIFISVEVIGKG